MSKAESRQCKLDKGGTEVVALRAPDEGERDYERHLEEETWCHLHPDLRRRQLGLRFLVRKIKPAQSRKDDTVIIGGVQVTNMLVVENRGTPVIVDDNVNRRTTEELTWSLKFAPKGKTIHRLERRSICREEFRAQFGLQVGDCFELDFDYCKRAWAGKVTLVGIKEEAAFAGQHSHLIAQFGISFEEARAEID